MAQVRMKQYIEDLGKGNEGKIVVMHDVSGYP
jgi:hypothetical protein